MTLRQVPVVHSFNHAMLLGSFCLNDINRGAEPRKNVLYMTYRRRVHKRKRMLRQANLCGWTSVVLCRKWFTLRSTRKALVCSYAYDGMLRFKKRVWDLVFKNEAIIVSVPNNHSNCNIGFQVNPCAARGFLQTDKIIIQGESNWSDEPAYNNITCRSLTDFDKVSRQM